MVGPRGFEPRTTGAQAPHPTRLDDGPTSFPRNNLISGGGYVLCFFGCLKVDCYRYVANLYFLYNTKQNKLSFYC